jgi:hypothetical protein
MPLPIAVACGDEMKKTPEQERDKAFNEVNRQCSLKAQMPVQTLAEVYPAAAVAGHLLPISLLGALVLAGRWPFKVGDSIIGDLERTHKSSTRRRI